MAEGGGFPFPSLPLNEGRTYGQPEVVMYKFATIGNWSALRWARSVGGAFSQTCSCRRGHSCAEGVPTASLLQNQKKMLSEINAGYGRKVNRIMAIFSLYSKDCPGAVKEKSVISHRHILMEM